MEPSTSRDYSASPVLFHPYHGENIQLLDHRQRALRRVSFEKGVVFSERPLLERECFFISIETVEGGWSGHLRIGLTVVDPESRPNIRNVENESWLVSVSPFMVPLSGSSSPNALPTEKGSLIGIYYERASGHTRLHVVLNGFDMCPALEGIPLAKQLFAVVDVFGSTKEVRVVLPNRRVPDRLSSLCSHRVNYLVREGMCSTRRLPPPLRNTLEQ